MSGTPIFWLTARVIDANTGDFDNGSTKWHRCLQLGLQVVPCLLHCHGSRTIQLIFTGLLGFGFNLFYVNTVEQVFSIGGHGLNP